MANQSIWIMSSAYAALTLEQVLDRVREVGAQGVELCVFRQDGTRQDHVATHLDYETFGPDEAARTLDRMQQRGLRFSIGAYENLIGGDLAERVRNQDHLLALIRLAALMGGDANDVKVGTFVGYNHEWDGMDGGFEKNLEAYRDVFGPILRYAVDLGVTVLYENCPMEGWRPATSSTTYNNLPATLAARKLMYALLPTRAHGETYDPSHDVWQNLDPSDVIRHTDPQRLHRVHVKATRINRHSLSRIHWGGMYPMQSVDAELAARAGVPIPAHDWDRHHYEAMLPGFGGSDSMDWRAFVDTVQACGFRGPFVIENEADNSSHTGNPGATTQGFAATVLNLAPMLWPLTGEVGYRYDASAMEPFQAAASHDLPRITMKELG